jgi:hypothetical protein
MAGISSGRNRTNWFSRSSERSSTEPSDVSKISHGRASVRADRAGGEKQAAVVAERYRGRHATDLPAVVDLQRSAIQHEDFTPCTALPVWFGDIEERCIGCQRERRFEHPLGHRWWGDPGAQPVEWPGRDGVVSARAHLPAGQVDARHRSGVGIPAEEQRTLPVEDDVPDPGADPVVPERRAVEVDAPQRRRCAPTVRRMTDHEVRVGSREACPARRAGGQSALASGPLGQGSDDAGVYRRTPVACFLDPVAMDDRRAHDEMAPIRCQFDLRCPRIDHVVRQRWLSRPCALRNSVDLRAGRLEGHSTQFECLDDFALGKVHDVERQAPLGVVALCPTEIQPTARLVEDDRPITTQAGKVSVPLTREVELELVDQLAGLRQPPQSDDRSCPRSVGGELRAEAQQRAVGQPEQPAAP